MKEQETEKGQEPYNNKERKILRGSIFCKHMYVTDTGCSAHRSIFNLTGWLGDLPSGIGLIYNEGMPILKQTDLMRADKKVY